MTQQPLFCTSYREAILSAIMALGGFKVVGAMLWPSKEADVAGDQLAKCLNPKKREKLSPDELGMIRRACRQQGCHVLAAWEMADAGYAPPQAVEPEDELAALQRKFIEASAENARTAERIQRLATQMQTRKR